MPIEVEWFVGLGLYDCSSQFATTGGDRGEFGFTCSEANGTLSRNPLQIRGRGKCSVYKILWGFLEEIFYRVVYFPLKVQVTYKKIYK